MGKPVIDASLEEYERCGFLLKANHDGSLDVKAINAESGGLAVGCSLNLAVWGAKGNFLLDPDEDGLRAHIPVIGQPFNKPTESKNRIFLEHGLWFIDIVYALDKEGTKVVDKEITETFEIHNDKDGALAIRRKFVHKMYQYKWPYILRCYSDGRLKIALKRPMLLLRMFERLR